MGDNQVTWPRSAKFAGKHSRQNLLASKKRVMRLNALSRLARKKEREFRSQKSEKQKETDPIG